MTYFSMPALMVTFLLDMELLGVLAGTDIIYLLQDVKVNQRLFPISCM